MSRAVDTSTSLEEFSATAELAGSRSLDETVASNQKHAEVNLYNAVSIIDAKCDELVANYGRITSSN